MDALREIYYVKPVDNSRLVPVTDPREPRQYLRTTLLAALLCAAVTYVAWLRFSGVREGYALEVLRQQKQQLLEAHRKLQLEEATLVDPVRIDRIARTQLGMSPASPHQIVRLEVPPLTPDAPALATARPVAPPLPSPVKNVAAAVP